MGRAATWLLVAASLGAAACGGDGGTVTTGGGCTPTGAASITITSTGVAPKAVCVLPGGSVTFANQDSVAHDIEAGTACPALNLGSIPAGQSRAATLTAAGVCTYSDATSPTNTAFQGTVAVSSAPTTGPGY